MRLTIVVVVAAVAVVGAQAQAHAAPPPGDALFVATRACRPQRARLPSGVHDVRALGRALAETTCRSVRIPLALADRRAEVSFVDAGTPDDGAERIRAGLRAAGLTLVYDPIEVVDFVRSDLFDLLEDPVVVAPPAACSTVGAPPRWPVDGQSDLATIVEARARLVCRAHVLARTLAERRVTFGLDAHTDDRALLEARVGDALHAHGLVVLRDRLERLAPLTTATTTTAAATTPAPAPPPSTVPTVDDELAATIRCATAGHCRIRRALVDRALADVALLIDRARSVPAFKDGRALGLKLYAIRAGSLLDRIGLQNADTVRTVNGFAMDTPEHMLETYTRLRTATRLVVAVDRRAQPITLEIVID